MVRPKLFSSFTTSPLTTLAFQHPGQSRYVGQRRSTTCWAGCSRSTRMDTALWRRQSQSTRRLP